MRRLHINATDRKSIYNIGPTPKAIERGSLLLNKDISYGEQLLETSSMKEEKSVGPDGALSELIINLCSLVLRIFLKLINLTWKTQVPHQWRKSRSYFVAEKKKPENSLDSYRPISLTRICCEVTEKMVECSLQKFYETKGAISDYQARIRRHLSTMDQVVKLTLAI
ncbi:hypothetical protein TNCT_171091 [Trichonephila clavata]|uniref:Uncharacterized protein n=1 Tax=Trichonephila clavata TaxID=2740835 RepID=A0A8X6JP90_TRICU|nr:hypothetical protein TNCT_171091 [Trichonephila clavata]